MKKLITSVITILILLFISFLPSFAQETTPENSIQKTVEERVKQAIQKPKAFIGLVTDKTEDTMQLESDENEIKLISIDKEEASFAKTNGSSQTISFEDIGIGDYIIAMGFLDNNNVLTSKRIVVSSPSDQLQDESFIAVITITDTNQLTVEKKPHNEIVNVTLARNYDVTETDKEDGRTRNIRFNSLKKGDKLIIIGESLNDEFEAERLHVIESTPESE